MLGRPAYVLYRQPKTKDNSVSSVIPCAEFPCTDVANEGAYMSFHN